MTETPSFQASAAPTDVVRRQYLASANSDLEALRATLADARDVVTREWSRAQTAKLKEQFYRMLAARYTVRVEADANVTRTARK